MQLSSKSLSKTVVILTALLLTIGIFVVVINASMQAKADSAGDRQYIGNMLNSYLAGQPSSDTAGENGVVIPGGVASTAGSLHKRLDSNEDSAILAEYDDAANTPIIVDVDPTQTTFVPGTVLRVAASGVASSTSLLTIKDAVAKHRQLGLSTDIVVYCLTGHTQSPAVMALGALSQAHFFDSAEGTTPPKVYGLKYGRLGWGGNTNAPTYTSTKPITTSLITPAATALPALLATCGAGSDIEKVQCRAAEALSWTTNPANITEASSSSLVNTTNLAIDVRPTLAAGTSVWAMTTGASKTLNLPLATLFSDDGSGSFANLQKLNNTKTNWFTGESQHLGGMAAQGALMMSFTTSKVKIESWGNAKWNSTLPTQFTVAGRGYDYAFVAGSNANPTTGLDNLGPMYFAEDYAAPGDVAGDPANHGRGQWAGQTPYSDGVTDTAAAIHWKTPGEASMGRLEYSTDPALAGATVVSTSDEGGATLLAKDHDVSLTGLAASTTYYYRANAYDGLGNGGPVLSDNSQNPIHSFTTAAPACTPAKPDLSVATMYAYWADLTSYNAGILSVKLKISNNGLSAANHVILTSASGITNGVTQGASGWGADLGTIAGSGNVVTSVTFSVGAPGSQPAGFKATINGSAADACGTGWTYP